MDGLLTAVKTVNINENVTTKAPSETLSASESTFREKQLPVNSPEDAINILRSRPEKADVVRVLRYLDPSRVSNGEFNINAPSPIAAQILHLLVTTTIPDHLGNLESETEDKPTSEQAGSAKSRAVLLRCLSSVAGLGALVAHLRTLLATRESGKAEPSVGTETVIRNLVSVLSLILKPKPFLLHIYTDISRLVENSNQRQIMWKELVSLIAAGRVLSIAAEAGHAVKDVELPSSALWVSDGSRYTTWLGQSTCNMASKLKSGDMEAWRFLAQLTGRSLSLGYSDQLVKEIYQGLLLREAPLLEQFSSLLNGLRRHEQETTFEHILRTVEKTYFNDVREGATADTDLQQRSIGGVAALIATIIQVKDNLRASLNEWLVSGLGGGIRSIALRRALLASFGTDTDTFMDVLKKALASFGDKLYIKHTPIKGQEANTQVILLSAGCVHRLAPSELQNITKSGLYLTAISNRLAASSPRARFLGMIVGMSLSRLADPPDQAMKFSLEEMESDEASWYMSLPDTRDKIGSIQQLILLEQSENERQKGAPAKQTAKSKAPKTKPQPVEETSKIISIEEVSEESEDDDLMSYEKPDSDASDSEEDPTLIDRSKPSAPVYIRDLLSYLRDTENVEKYHLGISTAPGLIRRKASFGTEVVENADELGLLLASLQDKYKLPNFEHYRIQGEIALMVAYPLTMGQWFTHTLFNADLSQSQRTSILVAIGLSARELAGFGKEDAEAMGLPASSDTSFPSKRLPSHLETVYGSVGEPISAISKTISQRTLQPLALNAADTVTGPNALKVRTFSSRMDVEKKRQRRELERKRKTTSKDLYKSLSDGFFFPLTGGFGLMSYATSSSSAFNPFLTPHLLRLFVQTVTLVLSALGPHSPNIITLTHDSLALLISLHNSPVATEPLILPALLSLFLAIVDINISSGSAGEERLVTEFATQVMEMREWTNGVFERTPSGEEEVRMLAAGILVKLGEVMERYQGRLLGTDVGFAY